MTAAWPRDVPCPAMTCKVIDQGTGAPVPYGTVGELCVRGYSLMQGYYKQPEETAAVVDAEGWLHTGDVVTMREDGTIRFLGRYKDLLKVGGENVDPIEVEGFLLRHPAIDHVQMIGVPDPRLSEVPCACIIPKPGEAVTQEALVAFCRGQLASFKIPAVHRGRGRIPHDVQRQGAEIQAAGAGGRVAGAGPGPHRHPPAGVRTA